MSWLQGFAQGLWPKRARHGDDAGRTEGADPGAAVLGAQAPLAVPSDAAADAMDVDEVFEGSAIADAAGSEDVEDEDDYGPALGRQSDSDSVGSSTLSSGYASELDADVSESDASDAEDDAEAMLCPPGQVMVPTFAPRVRRSGDDDADASDGRGQDRATLQAASADAPAPVPSADATPTAARHLRCSAPAALVETVRCGTARVVSPPRFWPR